MNLLVWCGELWLHGVGSIYIYIYIYIEREREREYPHARWLGNWLVVSVVSYRMVFFGAYNIIFKCQSKRYSGACTYAHSKKCWNELLHQIPKALFKQLKIIISIFFMMWTISSFWSRFWPNDNYDYKQIEAKWVGLLMNNLMGNLIFVFWEEIWYYFALKSSLNLF